MCGEYRNYDTPALVCAGAVIEEVDRSDVSLINNPLKVVKAAVLMTERYWPYNSSISHKVPRNQPEEFC